jgi:serine/threonine protein kinase
VLISEELVAKVADYGLSRSVDNDRNYYRIQTGRPLPLRWTAPEVLQTWVHSVATDVFSFGVLLYEVFSNGGFPFDAIHDDNEVIAILSGSGGTQGSPSNEVKPIEWYLQFVAPDSSSAAAQRLLAACVQRDPLTRPTFANLVDLTSKCPDGPAPVLVTAAREESERGEAIGDTSGGHVDFEA